MDLLVFALLTTAAYYLGSRATITRWLWTRYPKPLAMFFDCAACSGCWYGFFLAWLSKTNWAAISGFPMQTSHSPITIGLCSIVWTPIVAGIMQKGFEWNGTTLDG